MKDRLSVFGHFGALAGHTVAQNADDTFNGVQLCC